MSAPKDLPEIRMSAESLYREELFTDRRVGSIRRLTPVKPDGSDDGGRAVLFDGQTSLLTSAGPLPLTFEIDARTLAEAVAKFPDAARAALESTLKELEEIRREASSSLIVPGRTAPGLGNVGRPPTGNIRIP